MSAPRKSKAYFADSVTVALLAVPLAYLAWVLEVIANGSAGAGDDPARYGTVFAALGVWMFGAVMIRQNMGRDSHAAEDRAERAEDRKVTQAQLAALTAILRRMEGTDPSGKQEAKQPDLDTVQDTSQTDLNASPSRGHLNGGDDPVFDKHPPTAPDGMSAPGQAGREAPRQ